MDHAPDGVVGDEEVVVELHRQEGDWAIAVSGGEPEFDGAAVIGDAGGKSDGVLH